MAELVDALNGIERVFRERREAELRQEVRSLGDEETWR
jgi:hypothetical protein